MRKIFSILLALGLLVSMSLVTMPAVAQTCGATIVPDEICATETGNFTITFDLEKTLLAGNDSIVIEFPDGFTFDEDDTEVTIDGIGVVPPANVDFAGSVITILVHEQIPPTVGLEIVITFVTAGDEWGAEQVMIGLDRDCCEYEFVDCAELTVRRPVSTYKLGIDHSQSPTMIDEYLEEDFDLPEDVEAAYYEGLKKDWFPPTKYGTYNLWKIIIDRVDEGCAGEEEAVLRITLTDAPDGATVDGWFFGFGFEEDWVWTEFELEFDAAEDPPYFEVGPLDLDAGNQGYFEQEGWNYIPIVSKADMKGDYTICIDLYKEVPAPEPPCEEEQDPPYEEQLAGPNCYTHTEYQWMDAFGIELYGKWNLISLPLLPFDPSVASILEPLPNPEDLISIWNYDHCKDAAPVDRWTVYNPAANITDLDELHEVDGYWVKMKKTSDPQTLWVFGTARPMPPDMLENYPVCQGFNQIGFLPVWDRSGFPAVPEQANDDEYLWNWQYGTYGGYAEYGLIYSWDASDPYDQDWIIAQPGVDGEFIPGFGYWISFNRGGTIDP